MKTKFTKDRSCNVCNKKITQTTFSYLRGLCPQCNEALKPKKTK